MNYYNENNKFAAAWLKELISAGHLPAGDVDTRSIKDVKPKDLEGYTQCHFFAGIGGWPLALDLSGWPDNLPVWTGSCPCQPYSVAGQRRGAADDRNLWPTWFDLIRECQPAIVFGEQVASKDGLRWLDGVSTDLEGAGYAFGAADLCAAGVNAPHIRQRLYFGASRLGQSDNEGHQGHGGFGLEQVQRGRAGEKRHSSEARMEVLTPSDGSPWESPEWVLCRDNHWRPVRPGTFPLAHGVSAGMGRLFGYGNAIVPQLGAEFITAFSEAIK